MKSDKWTRYKYSSFLRGKYDGVLGKESPARYRNWFLNFSAKIHKHITKKICK